MNYKHYPEDIRKYIKVNLIGNRIVYPLNVWMVSADKNKMFYVNNAGYIHILYKENVRDIIKIYDTCLSVKCELTSKKLLAKFSNDQEADYFVSKIPGQRVK